MVSNLRWRSGTNKQTNNNKVLKPPRARLLPTPTARPAANFSDSESAARDAAAGWVGTLLPGGREGDAAAAAPLTATREPGAPPRR